MDVEDAERTQHLIDREQARDKMSVHEAERFGRERLGTNRLRTGIHDRIDARAQKIVNLRRDPRATVLVESGARYKELSGVMVRGRVELIDGPAALAEALSLTGADPNNPAAVHRAQKRVVMRFHAERWASWDHSKIVGDY